MTLPIARDLKSEGIRVVTIAPSLVDSPMTDYMPQDVKEAFNEIMVSPERFCKPSEFVQLVETIIGNTYLNGTTIRLDAGLRTLSY